MTTIPDIDAIPSAARHRSLKAVVLRLSILLFLVSASRADPVIYPAPQGAPGADKYLVEVNGRAVFVYDARIQSIHANDPRNCSYAYFDLPAGESARIRVTVPAGFNTAKVRPVSANIEPQFSENSLEFSVSKPQHLAVTLNGSYVDPLFLFINPVEVNPPKPGDAGVRYYGPGIHAIGHIQLTNNETVYLAGGAIVQGTFSSSNSTHITIRGRGILDCHENKESLMRFNNSQHIRLEGFIAVDHPQMKWAITFRSCDYVTVDNIKAMHGDHWSNDALNFVNCRHCWISNCFIKTQDDCICIKAMGTSRRDSKDIHVANCFLWNTWAHGLAIGAELNTDSVSDITFKNIDIVHLPFMVDAWGWGKTFDYYGALAIFNSDNAVVSNVRFEDIRVEIANKSPRLINLRIARSNWSTTADRGHIKNIVFKDIQLLNEEGNGWDGYLHGFDESRQIENVTFENLKILGNTIGNAVDARFDTAWITNLSFTTSSVCPVTNSLGMEFLPAGTSNVLVSRWETRVQDFAAFVQATGYDALSESSDGKRPFTLEADAANASRYDWKQAGGSWQDPHFPQTPMHPATCISYHDAVRFCAWLTRHEADHGSLPKGWRYRLPTDAEWSRAAGAVEYPWGDPWPPTARDGNYCGTESRIGFTDTPKWKCMEDVCDFHPRTAPVGSYASNAFGLFDLGGNVWEWCSTWYQTNLNHADLDDPAIVQGFPALLDDGGGRQNRVVRGGSWHAQRQVDLRTRFRGIGDPRIRFDDFGFRCVLAREDTTPAEWPEAPGTDSASRREHVQYFPPLIWPSSPPPDCPFEPSEDIAAIRFTGVHSDYRIADTWYPTWAADGNLYSPFTDGWVNQDSANSDGYELVHGPAWGSHGVTRRKATTGQAVIVGDDPLNLTITSLGTSQADPYPYGGRYPCGSLVYQGVWYYGTYCLAPHGSTLFGGTIYNWPWLGPFVGFRTSTDMGQTWQETPWTPEKPLFGENGLWGYPVKIGAPHFVDYGKELEHSPDGKAYLVAHGAVHPDAMPRFANLSWITGDQVYLLRVEPSLQNMNDAAQYEFYGGKDQQDAPIWTRNFTLIKPLLEWNNNMGCVTVTYNAPLRKYFMCVTDGGNTCARMNTYILESNLLTGPWRLVTYMKHFGEQAYFVNIPSKFISPDGTKAWLCYSANFASNWNNDNIGSNPPGSRYGLVLQEIEFLDSAAKQALKRKQSAKSRL